jgi:chromosome segregation ATPase
MLKKLLIGLSAFVILLMLALTYVTARFVDHKAILAAQTEARQMRTARDSILSVVAVRESLQQQIHGWEQTLETQTQGLRTLVNTMEQGRQETQLGIRRLATRDTLAEELHKAYPQFSDRMRVTEIYDPETERSYEYLMLPMWFADAFLVDHRNAISYGAQRDSLRVLDSLQQRIKVLKDSIFHLEQQKAMAFRTGYDSAFAKYEVVNQRYVDLLAKPPHVTLGLPRWTTMLGTAGLGFAAGVLVNRD